MVVIVCTRGKPITEKEAEVLGEILLALHRKMGCGGVDPET